MDTIKAARKLARCSKWENVHYTILPLHGRIAYTFSHGPTLLTNPTNTKICLDSYVEPLSVNVWVKDMALIYSVVSSHQVFTQLALVSVVNLLAHRLPSYLQSQTKPLNSEVKEPMERNNIWIGLRPFIAEQNIILIPFKFQCSEIATYDFKPLSVELHLLIGSGDYPLLRLLSGTLAKFEDNRLTVRNFIRGECFNSEKALWQPLVEPWRIGVVISVPNISGGLATCSVTKVEVLSEHMLDINLTRHLIDRSLEAASKVVTHIAKTERFLGSSYFANDAQMASFKGEFDAHGAYEILIINQTGAFVKLSSGIRIPSGGKAIDDTDEDFVLKLAVECMGTESYFDIQTYKLGDYYIGFKRLIGSLHYSIGTRDGDFRYIELRSMGAVKNSTQTDIKLTFQDK